MPLNISNDYHSHRQSIYESSSCCFYYFNSLKSRRLPKSMENAYLPTNEHVQFEETTNTYLLPRNQRHSTYAIRRQSYQPINYNRTMSVPSVVYRSNKMHRSDSHKNDKHPQFNRQFERANSIHNSQQSDMFPSIDDCCSIIRHESKTISPEKLTHLLNKLTFALKSFDPNSQQQQQLSIIIDVLHALIDVRSSIIVAVSQHEFFSVLERLFIYILRQWRRHSFLPENESFMFHMTVKLIQRLVASTADIKFIPSWLSDSVLLEIIFNCLTDIINSKKFLDDDNRKQFKSFTNLIDAYIHYQQRLNDELPSQKDKLVQLLDPILHCLTSSHFIRTFETIPIDAKSMTTIQKFFLVKCPAFLTSYNGSHLETTMESLLSIMLHQYTQLLDKLVPSASEWKRSIIRSVDHLLEIIDHGADESQTNARLVSYHLSIIDHILKLINEPKFYNNLDGTLSNVETIFMDTAIRFLVNMINAPAILAHIKQCEVADTFLRLTSCKYEPLVFNVYTLLAYTTREEDIKAMDSPGRLLATTIESLKTTLNEKPDKTTQIEQLLETLKGLVQHDQIKDEIIKQNALPFLLECMGKLTGRSLVIIFEILWCLTFFEEIASVLRGNSEFLKRIQTISKDNSNVPLKKAADGLVWKIIQEPESLEKVAKQVVEEEAVVDEKTTTTKVGIGKGGEKQVLKTKKRGSMTPSERSYRYDIMISYCHTDKELTYKIHKFLLDQRFKVWIDLDNMYGPAMSAMADAVENSEFVIMCMSDSYKQSSYCQAEAEYAFKCRRRLIPLIMRQGYRPDGWLGLMIGSRMYIDFIRYDFDVACEKLLTEISLQREQVIPTIIINQLDHEKPDKNTAVESQNGKKGRKASTGDRPATLPIKKDILASVFKVRQSKVDFMRKPINQWTESDVTDFLLTNRLHQLIPLCEAMNGLALIQLFKICISRRLRAYTVLKDEIKFAHRSNLSLNVYSQFLSVTEQAINSMSVPLESTIQSSSIDYSPQLTTSIPFVPAPDLNTSYDFSITTNASALDTLKMVETYGSQLQLLDSLRRRITNVF